MRGTSWMSGAVLVLAGALSAHAAEPVRPVPELDLAAVVDAAVENDPRGQALAAEQAHARVLGERAGSFLDGPPSLGIAHQNDALASDTGLSEWQASVELPLRRPGLRGAARREAERAGEVAASRAAALRLAVAGQVRERLWQLAEKREALAVARRELATARELQASVEKRLERGDVPRTDLLLAREETLQREIDVDRARLELEQARAAYRRLTGLDRRPETTAESPATSVSLQQHPGLASARASTRRAQAAVAVAREQHRAQPTLGFNLRSEDDGVETVESVGFSVSVPLETRKLRAPAVSGAAMALARAEADYRERERAIRLAVEQAEQAMRSARERLARAEERLSVARESLSIAEKAYRLGESSLLDLLRVRSRSFDAERRAVMGRIDLHRAIARYNQAKGVTP